MEDLNVPPGGSYSEFSTGITNSCSNQTQKYSVINECTRFDDQISQMKSPFDDSKIFCDIFNNNDNLWDGRFQIIHELFLFSVIYLLSVIAV